MKKFIQRIPVLGDLASKAYRKLRGNPGFKTSWEYWEDRYRFGGNSGAGSYDRLAAFKGEVIEEFREQHAIADVIEFGCGDGNQLQYFHPRSYLGFDVSRKAVHLCRERYGNDPSKRFEELTAYAGETAELTLSLDVIYHLVEDSAYTAYMDLLFRAARRFVIIYSSNTDDDTDSAPHVRHRRFTDRVEREYPDFTLVRHIPNRYPYDGDDTRTSKADFFLYERQGAVG